jgi:iron complex outermembrane receptor protein
VLIITSEDASLEGLLSTTEILQTNVLTAGSAQVNDQLTGFNQDNGPGANTVALRGIGSARTLVLLNGRRLSPAGARGKLVGADLNVIPSSIVQRTEILKDGASSVYGSDAIAGVINLLTNQRLDEARINLSGNNVFDGGGETQNFSGAWGKTWNDKTNASLSFEYYKRDPLLVKERDFLNCSQDLLINVTTDPRSLLTASAGQQLDSIDPRTGESKCYHFTILNALRLGAGPNANADYIPNPTAVSGGGVLGRDLAGWQRIGGSITTVIGLRPGQTPASNLATYLALRASNPGVDDPRYGDRTFISPAERNSIFAQASHEFSDSAKLYAEYLWNNRKSSQASFRQFFPGSGAAGTFLNAANAANTFGVPVLPIMLFPSDSYQDIDFQRGVVGLTGDFSVGPLNDWTYDVFVQKTESDAQYSTLSIYADRVFASTQAGTCNSALIRISGPTDCVSVRWTNPDVISKGYWGMTSAERDFLTTFDVGRTTYDQTTFGASITGNAFSLPAGEVGVVLGVERRKDEIDDIPGPVAINNNAWGQTTAGRTVGEDTVQEVFSEIELPLLRDLPAVKRLSFNGSFRWTDYDSYGSDTTYKAGLNWQVIDSLRLRGAYGTSFRAPALFEQFLANLVGFNAQTAVDPCINWSQSSDERIRKNCAAAGVPGDYAALGSSSVTVLEGGGGKGVLSAETSNNTTIGLVWTPEALPLSAAVDWWRIEIENQVGLFGASNIVRSCYTSPQYPTDPFCELFTRASNNAADRANQILQVKNAYVNISNQIVEGTDWTVRFDKRFGKTRFTAQALVSYNFVDSSKLFPTSPNTSSRGLPYNNKWVSSLDLRFERGPWTFNWNIDTFSPTTNDKFFGGDVFGGIGLPNCATASAALAPYCVSAKYDQSTNLHFQHDMSLRYRADKWEAVVGVNNVFDQDPPIASTASVGARIGNAISQSNYDILGRRAFVNVGYRF